MNKLLLVLNHLKDAGLKVNADKLFFCSTTCEYLGYVLPQDGIRPQHKKVEAILALKSPYNVKTLRRFSGIIQYYQDI